MIISVIMQIEHSIQLGVASHVEIVRRLQTFADGLPRVLLHLDVVEFSVTIFT